MDIGRWDLFLRLGMMQHAFAKGQKPVVVDIGIRFKKSLQPGQKFVLETELTHTHSKIFYMEQRFLVSGRGDSEVVYAQAQIKGMILDKAGKIMHAGKALAALNHGQALVEERGQDKDETNQTKG